MGLHENPERGVGHKAKGKTIATPGLVAPTKNPERVPVYQDASGFIKITIGRDPSRQNVRGFPYRTASPIVFGLAVFVIPVSCFSIPSNLRPICL